MKTKEILTVLKGLISEIELSETKIRVR